MKYLKIRDDETIVPIETIYDLVASDKRRTFFTMEDKPNVIVGYPNSDTDIQSVKIVRSMDRVIIDIVPNIGYRLDGIDIKRYSAGHFSLLREYHNEDATRKLLRTVVCDGFLTNPENVVIRVLTEDNRVYSIYNGVILFIGMTLRVARVLSEVPNSKVKEIQVGPYEATKSSFVFEKLTVPKRDLVFS